MTEPPPRRIPLPWRMVEKPGCFQVQDATGQVIGWFYCRHDDGAARQTNVLTHDEARRMARIPRMRCSPSQGAPQRMTRASRKAPSLLIPANAIIFNRGGLQVAVVQNGVAHIQRYRSRATSERR
jgi:hypothetical protein